MADPDLVIVFDSEGNKFQIPRHMLSQFSNMGPKMRSRFPTHDGTDPTTGNNPNYPRQISDDEFSQKLWPSPTPMGGVPSEDGMGETKTIRRTVPKAEEAYQKLRTRRGGPQ